VSDELYFGLQVLLLLLLLPPPPPPNNSITFAVVPTST
jgi:hypothetical protein